MFRQENAQLRNKKTKTKEHHRYLQSSVDARAACCSSPHVQPPQSINTAPATMCLSSNCLNTAHRRVVSCSQLMSDTNSQMARHVASASAIGPASSGPGQPPVKLCFSSSGLGSAPQPAASTGIRISAPIPGHSRDSDSIQLFTSTDHPSTMMTLLMQQQQMMQQQMVMMQSHLFSQPSTAHHGLQTVSIYSI